MSLNGGAELGPNTKRVALRLAGWPLLALSFQTLGMSSNNSSIEWILPSDLPMEGIIYSDIGTSPLYVLNGIWPSSGPLPSKEDIIGGISAIIWSLTLLPMLKYVRKSNLYISLHILSLSSRFGSPCISEPKKVGLLSFFRVATGAKPGFIAGEGGSFALYQGLYPREAVDHDADRTLTGEYTGGKEQTIPPTLREKIRWPLLLWVSSMLQPRVYFILTMSHSVYSAQRACRFFYDLE